jgi:hypothetical protein
VKSRNGFRLAIVSAIVLFCIFIASPSQSMAQAAAAATDDAKPAKTSRGMAAVAKAAKDNKYLFIFFWKENDKHNQAMYGVFQSAMKKWADTANSVSIPIKNAKVKPIVEKFGVSRAPMPLVLVLAPNGAITKGIPLKFTEEQLEEGFVSRGTAKCMKALQDKKLVLLCVQNKKTQFSQVALKGAQDFKADARYAKATEIVTLDPADKAEKSFLTDLKVDPKTTQAVTVILAPPGRPVASFTGAVTKDQIIAKIKAGPCAGGKCGPGGCP